MRRGRSTFHPAFRSAAAGALWGMLLAAHGTGVAAAGEAPLTPPAAANAVTPAPLPLSVEDAVRRAQETSEALAVARAALTRARGERYRALSEWLPSLNGSVGYDRTLATEFDVLFEQTPAAPTGAEGGAIPETFAELPFGQRNIWRYGLLFSQNLFAGGRSLAMWNLASASRRMAEAGVASARAVAVLTAAQAYYDAVLSEQLLAIAEATLERAKDTFEQTRLGRRVGAQPEFELLRAQVSYENQRPLVVQRRMQRDLALLRLRQLLDIPPERPLVLTTALDGRALAQVGVLAREVADAPPADASGMERAPVRLARHSVSALEAGLRVARSVRLPSISLNSSYGRVGYPDSLSPFDADYRTNWTVGVALQVPLFTGFRLTGEILNARASVQEAQARLAQTVELTALDSMSTRKELEAAEALWLATEGTVKQAQRAYEIGELRFREGVSTQLELSDARLLLQQAQANRAQAARDVQVARIRVALLANLPLTGAAAAALASQGNAAAGGAASAPGAGAAGMPQGTTTGLGVPAAGAGGSSAMPASNAGTTSNPGARGASGF